MYQFFLSNYIINYLNISTLKLVKVTVLSLMESVLKLILLIFALTPNKIFSFKMMQIKKRYYSMKNYLKNTKTLKNNYNLVNCRLTEVTLEVWVMVYFSMQLKTVLKTRGIR